MNRFAPLPCFILVFLIACSAENVKTDSESVSQDVFGLIEYQIFFNEASVTLSGKWTTLNYGEKLGREKATGGAPGTIVGDYEVNTFGSTNKLLFSGTLTIAAVGTAGEAYSLIWTPGEDSPTQSSYIGRGIMAGSNRLAANYRGN